MKTTLRLLTRTTTTEESLVIDNVSVTCSCHIRSRVEKLSAPIRWGAQAGAGVHGRTFKGQP